MQPTSTAAPTISFKSGSSVTDFNFKQLADGIFPSDIDKRLKDP